jgi:hypothetical protein
MVDRIEEGLDAREIAIRELNSLRGRLCTVIESAGMPYKQERAIITLIKNLSFQNQAVIEKLLAELDTDGKRFTVVNNKLIVEENAQKVC